MSSGQRRIIIVTTTRADWGILSPLARALTLHPDVNLTIAAGNMHLLDEFGHTVDEIRAEGFNNIVCLDIAPLDRNPASRTAMSAAGAVSLARLIDNIRPDAVVMLGDRYEILGAAMAALIAGVPVVHLHGGEISEGAIDDSVRHAVSKLATLHLPATELAARRLQAMGEEPARIVRIGSIGVENAMNIDTMSLDELRESLGGFDIDPSRTLLVTFHPVTRHPGGIPTHAQVDALLDAIERVPQCNAVITFPNNDPGSHEILERLAAFAHSHSDRVLLVPSLGKRRYLSALHHVRAVVGNTSSGILEAPSTPAATIDIGPRQQGRERAKSVIHLGDNTAEIADAIRKVLSTPRSVPRPSDNPYFLPDATRRAADAIINILPTLPLTKKFHTTEK